MAKIAIVYHSGYGHTAVIAQAVARGAQTVEGTDVSIFDVEQAQQNWEALAAADGIIFGSPTYMGDVSGPFKTFADATSKVWFSLGWKNKIAAGFTNSGSLSGDKLHALTSMVILAAQHGMIWVGNDLMPGNNNSGGSPEDLNRVGSFLGMMSQSNVDQGPDVAPPASDQKTAEHFGARVATITTQFVAGRAASA